MPAPPPQDFVVTPDQLCVGLFVHIDLPWFSHPFSFNSFKIRTPEQIKTLRELGVHFRYDPERSDTQPRSNTPQPVAAPPAAAARRPRHQRQPGQQARTHRPPGRAQAQGGRSGKGLREGRRGDAQHQQEPLRPAQGVPRGSGELVNQMVTAFLDQPEVALHVMGEHPGGEETYFHGLNTSILAMMLAKELGFDRASSQALGVGALLHDIGLADIPDRVARPRHELTAPERHLRELHCDYGVRIGRQIGLPEPVLRIIAQHHELADGSGYPKGLKGEQIDPWRASCPSSITTTTCATRPTWPRP
jgi:putative nucleotidyltransferase with HDIG domain